MLVSDIEIGEKCTLISNPDLVIASVTQAMQEIEPVVEEEESDEFMEEGEESGETEDKGDAEKPDSSVSGADTNKES